MLYKFSKGHETGWISWPLWRLIPNKSYSHLSSCDCIRLVGVWFSFKPGYKQDAQQRAPLQWGNRSVTFLLTNNQGQCWNIPPQAHSILQLYKVFCCHDETTAYINHIATTIMFDIVTEQNQSSLFAHCFVWKAQSRHYTRDVVQPPVFVTAALKRK